MGEQNHNEGVPMVSSSMNLTKYVLIVGNVLLIAALFGKYK